MFEEARSENLAEMMPGMPGASKQFATITRKENHFMIESGDIQQECKNFAELWNILERLPEVQSPFKLQANFHWPLDKARKLRRDVYHTEFFASSGMKFRVTIPYLFEDELRLMFFIQKPVFDAQGKEVRMR